MSGEDVQGEMSYTVVYTRIMLHPLSTELAVTPIHSDKYRYRHPLTYR